MPQIEYVPRTFRDSSMEIVARARQICEEYARQGYDLTLRQLYYQFVSRDWLPNRQAEYKRLGSIVNDARLAGLLDWDYIVDRTRNVRGGDTESMRSPAEAIAEWGFVQALWEGQPYRCEVWVEKDALIGVLQRAVSGLRTPYFACRGYTSQSEAWQAARRIEGYMDDDHKVVILHLGDHDPSGIDMTRDIVERLNLFLDVDGYDPEDLEVRRIALNMDQVRQYNPPPNPAKMTDSRVGGYLQRFGRQSWELDALEPRVLDALIQAHIQDLIDGEAWNVQLAKQAEGRGVLRAMKEHYDDVYHLLEENGWVKAVDEEDPYDYETEE